MASASAANVSAETREREAIAQSGYPAGGLRFDWTATALSALFLAGLWIDGWAHFHNQVDDSFFTPWHFLFYSAFGLVALFFGYHQFQNVNKGYAFARALPKGYRLSLIGAVVFAVGGFGDMIWHTLFGIEAGTEALMSPTHIMLAIGMALIFTGPVRAAWLRQRDSGGTELRGWRALGPMIVGVTLFLTLLLFFTSYANPVVMPLAVMGGDDTSVIQTDQIYVMDADGSRQMRLVGGTENGASWPAWSPDGTQIAYTYGLSWLTAAMDDDAEALNNLDLYIASADGTNRRQLTSGEGLELSAVWSPDGAQLAYLGGTLDANGDITDQDIYVIGVDGGDPVRLTETVGNEWDLAWSPDGTQIAYSVDMQGESQDVWAMNADGTAPRQLTSNGDSWSPNWSSDGAQIVFNGYFDDSMGVYVMNADGSDVRQVINTGAFEGLASFTNNDTEVIFSSWEAGYGEIYRAPVTGIEDLSEAINLSNNPALNSRNATLSPDGGQILFVGRGQSVGGGGNFAPQDFGVTSVLFTSAIIGAVVVLLAWRWTLPFGTFTILFTVSTAMLTLLNDFFLLIPAALVAGLIVDVLVNRLKPSPERVGRLMIFAYAATALYFGLYFVTLMLAAPMGWSIHVWTGAVFTAGVIGLLIVLLLSASRLSADEAVS